MDKTLIALISLRGAALAAGIAGQSKLSAQLYQLADFIAAGIATDAHMQAVAEKLAVRNANDADFADVLARIEEERAQLHAPDAPTPDPPLPQGG